MISISIISLHIENPVYLWQSISFQIVSEFSIFLPPGVGPLNSLFCPGEGFLHNDCLGGEGFFTLRALSGGGGGRMVLDEIHSCITIPMLRTIWPTTMISNHTNSNALFQLSY